MPAFVRRDALPLGTFSKYTWQITNILQVKQIFDTPEVRPACSSVPIFDVCMGRASAQQFSSVRGELMQEGQAEQSWAVLGMNSDFPECSSRTVPWLTMVNRLINHG